MDISINIFVKLKPWYVRPIIVPDTCYHYIEKYELRYGTFIDFGKIFWKDSPPPTICVFISQILCEKDSDGLLYHEKCVGGNKFNHGVNLDLFHSKYPININDPSLSNITINWKRHKYVTLNVHSFSLTALSKNIDFLEDKICVINFLKKFEN